VTARFLIFPGLFFLLLGLLIKVLPGIPFLGRLPGDIVIKKDNFLFVFPLTSSLLLSLLLSLIFKFLKK